MEEKSPETYEQNIKYAEKLLEKIRQKMKENK